MPVIGAQGRWLLHEAVRRERGQLCFRRGDQQVDHLRRELHVTLEAVHQIAVFDDLTGAAFAIGDDLRAVG
ncbi:hypothetical protein D3C72_2220880 [compost metagenome]